MYGATHKQFCAENAPLFNRPDGTTVDSEACAMSSATGLWFRLVQTYGLQSALGMVLGAVCLLAIVVIAAAAGLRMTRRAIRHRRVARELARVHGDAYRERFGHRGRLI